MKKIIVVMLTLLLLACNQEVQKHKAWDKYGFATDDVVFIINADDVGMDIDSDKAVFELYELGKIQTYTIMVPTPNYDNAVKYSVENNVPLGVHLTLTNEWQGKNGWSPILSKEEVPSLYNESGYMWASVDEVANNVKVEEARKELKAQIDKAYADGLDITHLDCHMLFWFANEEMETMVIELAKEYKLPFVNQYFWLNSEEQIKMRDELDKEGIMVADRYWMYYDPAERANNPKESYTNYSRMFKNAKVGINHVAIHPSIINNSVREKFEDSEFRYDEYMVWKSDKLAKVVEDEKIKFVDYRMMRDIMQKL